MPSTDTACEGEEEVMASGRAADREDPQNSKRRVARSLDRDPISELHQGQRSDAPHQRAGHMTAPDHSAEANSTSFAGGGRPHMNHAKEKVGYTGGAPHPRFIGRAAATGTVAYSAASPT